MQYVYRVKTNYRVIFEKIMADKVTESCVYIKGSRVNRSSHGVRYFEKFEDARDYAVERLRKDLAYATAKVESSREGLKEALASCHDTLSESFTTY